MMDHYDRIMPKRRAKAAVAMPCTLNCDVDPRASVETAPASPEPHEIPVPLNRAEPYDSGGVVRPSGFEPETCGLRVRCSAVELEAHRESTPRRLQYQLRHTDTTLKATNDASTYGWSIDPESLRLQELREASNLD